MEKAIKLAPSKGELRKTFIEQLVEQQRYVEASEQYAKLTESNPTNADYYRDWGRMVLRNKEVALETRKEEAKQIWNRMLKVTKMTR